MLDRHISAPFELYCYTDDPNYICPWINIIPIENDSREGWWHKLELLKNTGNCLLLDLDIIILKDPTRLINYTTNTLTVIPSRWKRPKSFYKGTVKGERTSTLYNSSIMKWSGDQGKQVYDFFTRRDQEMMLKYSGIDRMLWNEDFKIDVFDRSIVYSYWLGNEYPDDIEPEKYREGFEVCIFNNGQKMESIQSWPQDYWR